MKSCNFQRTRNCVGFWLINLIFEQIMYNVALASEFFMRRKLQLNTYGTVAPRPSIQVFQTGRLGTTHLQVVFFYDHKELWYGIFILPIQWKFHESYATFSIEENNCNKSNFFLYAITYTGSGVGLCTVKDDATWNTSLKNEMIEPVIH